MAEIEYNAQLGDPEDHAEASVNPLKSVVNIAGALLSLGLVIGIGIWGYKLVVRDVSGVPVVRALEGPMRVQPQDPGGRPADHQGLAVNTVAAEGSAAAPADRLVLAPRPVELTDEDKPLNAGQPTELTAEEPLAEASAAQEEAEPNSVDELVRQLSERLTREQQAQEAQIETVAAIVPQPSPEPLPQIGVNADPAVLNMPGLKRSLRPLARPVRQEPATTGTASVIDVDAATVPAGTRLAQLGAYESDEIARKEWDRFAAQFSDYMGDKKRVIQKASSGGRSFYRLRVMGFADLSDTRRFCSVLTAQRVDCIPVTSR